MPYIVGMTQQAKASKYRLTAKILSNLAKPRPARTTEAEVFAGLEDEPAIAWEAKQPKCPNCKSPVDKDNEEAPWCGTRCKREDLHREFGWPL